MKKLITIFCVLMLSAPLFAQFSYGVKAGLNLASMTNIKNSEGKTGYYAGVVAGYRFSDLMSLQAEVAYSSQGVRYDGETTIDDMMGMKTEGAIKFNYINIPLLARVHIINGLSLEVGPQFGFVVGAKSKEDLVDYDDNSSFEKIDKSAYKSFDTSLAMGLSYCFDPRIELTARYNLGLTNVAKAGYKWSKNGVVQLGIGYRFK